MKLSEALFKEPWQAYQVLGEYWDSDDFSESDLQPLSGKTLDEEDVDGPFQGLFIIAGKMVSNKADPHSCYLDLTLPERIAGHHFVQIGGRLERRRGLRTADGRVIPAIGIEKLGDYTLFLASIGGNQRAQRRHSKCPPQGLLGIRPRASSPRPAEV